MLSNALKLIQLLLVLLPDRVKQLPVAWYFRQIRSCNTWSPLHMATRGLKDCQAGHTFMHTFMSAEKVCTLQATPRPRISAISSRALRSCWWLPHWLITVV